MGGSARGVMPECDEIVVLGYLAAHKMTGTTQAGAAPQADTRFPPPYRASADCVVSEPTRARRLPIFKANVGDVTLADEFVVGRDPAEHHAREDARVAVHDAWLAPARRSDQAPVRRS